MIVLVRIDDRLIHGQVTIGWRNELRPSHVVLVDDAVAQSAWEQELYRAAAPDGASVEALGIDAAAEAFPRLVADRRRVLVLTRSPQALAALAARGVRLPPVNVGGLHFSAGKREVLPYVFLDDADVAAFERLLAAGVQVEARDLPSNPAHDMAALLKRSEAAGR